ncbi:probable RNA helicase armi [Helicoverpa zea]|uniref:probable RNA helicase armi n=1 Tax=Helicoverpa zea TaxID=7113 RepID=UPI001F59F513|nr:probable RNA helicase armi [Helicoverpa zea]
MFSYIKSFFNYFFSNNAFEEYDKEMENYLADELVKLDLEQEESSEVADVQDIPRNNCFERTGLITYISEEGNYVLIDGMLYFDITACSVNLNLNDKVLYLCYKKSKDSLVVVRILENQGEHWGDFDLEVDENGYKVIEHVIIGEVQTRQDRYVIIKESDLKFSLDDVVATFVPIQGDMLEMMCKVQYDEDNPMDISSNMVVEVLSFRPLRSKVISTVITSWNGEQGSCDKQIFFNKHCVVTGGEPHVGARAFVEAVESNQGSFSWRVIKMDITENAKTITESAPIIDDIEERSLATESQNNIEVTYPLKFDNVNFNEKPQLTLAITNKSNQQIVMYRWMLLCKKRDSQINIYPPLPNSVRLMPNKTFNFTVTCHPKFYGKFKEHMIIIFRGFKIERLIEINISSDNIDARDDSSVNGSPYRNISEVNQIMKEMRNGYNKSYVPGVPLKKNPNFISVRLGQFNIPEKVWSAVIGNEYEQLSDHNAILERIETRLPCLLNYLNISNYMDRWHILLYLEEIQATINMKNFNMPSAFLVRHHEYLGVEIKKLSERRPSLIIGDKVIVKDIWDDKASSYEGYVHVIRGDLLLMKFHPRFHESYQGGDVSVEFHFNRTTLRKAHHAINLAITNLGPNVLFPSRLVTRPPQVPLEKLATMKWFNEKLNHCQMVAIKNILIGECRPMPYCIYGPPGTGKTITVVETLLQILTLIPDSRILVATPSNSAANLITERLLQYRNKFSSSIIRLIANYMVDSENIPEVIKPFCATLNIARENTHRPTHTVHDGINMNVPASYVARYRVTIGTCNCLGSLLQMDLPKGHFTHIIVDEAGQAIEPEIMIPMTFVNKETGQIILAGDPMQLGPVVVSKYCLDFGMDISFLSRILETFPYQKDFAAFENGFNNRLVTQLTDNYRSLQEVLTLPSEMFYDSTLVAKFDRSTPFVPKILDVVSEIYEIADNTKTGGIFVHGVKGNNAKAVDSPSWYNPEEASMVALTVCKLYKNNIQPDELGIITPYVAQIKHLRRLFDHMKLRRPKIATVEEFQGQERPLIIISTVRSTESLIAEDQKHSLGFVRSSKRLNVAITRAQVAVILFCDPHLLSTDPLWKKVINHAVKENKYMGCQFLPACNGSNEQNIDDLE